MRFRRRFATVGLCGLALLGSPQQSSATTITIASSADGSSCYMPVTPPGNPGNAYIYARLFGDAASNGITGAEFSIAGMPPEMFVGVTPSPASNVSLGNPFEAGCNIAFPQCQAGTGFGIVLLYTVNLFLPPGGMPDYVLQVRSHQTPSNPMFPCPLVTLCDPGFTILCVNGGNSAPGPLLQVPSNPSPPDGGTDIATNVDL